MDIEALEELDALGALDTLGELDALGEIDTLGTLDTLGAPEASGMSKVAARLDVAVDVHTMKCLRCYGLETIKGVNQECRAKCNGHFVQTYFVKVGQNAVCDLHSLVQGVLAHSAWNLWPNRGRGRRDEGKRLVEHGPKTLVRRAE